MKTKKYKKQKTKTKRRKIKKGGNTPSYLANVMKNPLYLTPTTKRNTQTRTKTKSKTKSNSNNDCTVMNISRPNTTQNFVLRLMALLLEQEAVALVKKTFGTKQFAGA